jgi:prolyl-tRNA editing enzyme YbaK/EbsC (Cys-tRNA(Pro) deacylase)
VREKVIDSARSLGLDVDVRYLEASTATAQEAAVAVGCGQAQIAKSLVFIADGDPVVCIAAGDHRVDEDLLADALDVAEIRQASPDEVRAATGYCVGGVPPTSRW